MLEILRSKKTTTLELALMGFGGTMPSKHLPAIENLRKRTAARVKSGFAGFVRDVRAAGCIAVTRRGKVELVFMDAALYRRVIALIQGAKERS